MMGDFAKRSSARAVAMDFHQSIHPLDDAPRVLIHLLDIAETIAHVRSRLDCEPAQILHPGSTFEGIFLDFLVK